MMMVTNTTSAEKLLPDMNDFSTSYDYLHSNMSESDMNENDFETKRILVMAFRTALVETYQKGFDMKKYVLFTVYLCFLSLIGSLSNMLVIVVLHFRDDCMELESVPKDRKSSETVKQQKPPPLISTSISGSNSTVVAKVNANNKPKNNPNKLVLNKKKKNASNTKPIYLLIHYLAIVDFLTCFLAIPATTVEIWLFTKNNEIFCKLFEQLRASGVLLSNFLVILISLERFLLLCKPFYLKKLKSNYFARLLAAITIVSFLLGTASMFTLSVYQSTGYGDIFVGVCLPKMNSSAILINTLKYVITTALILGIFFVKVLYVFIFKKALEVKRKKVDRKIFNDKIKLNAFKHSSLAVGFGRNSNTSTNGQIIIVEPCTDDQIVDQNSDEQKALKNNNNNNSVIGKNEIERLASVDSNFLRPGQKIKMSESRCSINVEKNEVSVTSACHINNTSSVAVGTDSPPGRKRSIVSTLFNRRSAKAANKSKSFYMFKANIRMALIIFCVTIVYYISVIPWTLTINGIIKYNPFIYYTFFINNAANPIIYGFFNPNFRRCCIEVLGIMFHNVKRVLFCRVCTEKNVEI
jgi:hypothetical protein